MGKLFRIIGPPGTGKTASLTRQISAAVQKYGRDGVVVASFTNTAAQELASRNSGMDGVGTLHHHAFRAIGKCRVAESLVDDFSRQYPRYAISASRKPSAIDEGMDQISAKTGGDELLAKLNTLRARLVPHDLWPSNVKAFDQAWSKWKYENDAVDFTDMIERAKNETTHAPGDPAVLFVDELQDTSPLAYELVKKWGHRCESVVVCGDADQTIFTFAGADPSVMLGEVDEERVLAQSYRVPVAVHEYARRFVKAIKQRNDYEYRPTSVEGWVKRSGYNLNTPDMMLDDIEKYTADGKKVMVLATCGYMLNPLIAQLRERGILYHNPWRPTNGAWNPIHTFDGDDDRISLTQRLLNFLAPCREVWGADSHLWSEKEFASWAEIIRAEAGISHGMKKALETLETDAQIDFRFVAEFFSDQASFWNMFETFDKRGAIDWVRMALTTAKKKQAAYPLKVIDKYGTKLDPMVTVGTIHSVKGAEADVVFVAPDLSISGMMEYTGGSKTRDTIMRLMYVALTRAREGVVLCTQAGANAVRWM